uniref:LisH domain-containing protein n=1 Tax=Syphacia muris TaxID=451379 RepID=A0A0N5B0C4_9BILA
MLEKGGEKSVNRKLLDYKRQLIVEFLEAYGLFPSGQSVSAFQNKNKQYFPNKQTLTLKIREVRQKMMALVQSPITPNGITENMPSLSSSSLLNQSDRTMYMPSNILETSYKVVVTSH